MPTIRKKSPDRLLLEAHPSQNPADDADMLVEYLAAAETYAAALAALMKQRVEEAQRSGRPAPRVKTMEDELRDMVYVLDDCITMIRDVRAKALRQH